MRIVVLTGSGISADSGVATFRDPKGIWAQYDWREVATPEAFAADPARVHAFYNLRRRALSGAAPNPAHYALAELESALSKVGGKLTLVTQNVDDLHERAGSANLLHMHGELSKARCGACLAVAACANDLSEDSKCHSCGTIGAMRPHVVWFGEIPLYMDEIAAALARADRFVAIGTSGSVWPAAGFAAEARAAGVPCTELNLEPSDNAAAFDETRYGRASEIVPAWAREMLERLAR